MNKSKALKIIAENKESYNKIAKDFDVTRKYEWPEFEMLKPHIKKYEVHGIDVSKHQGKINWDLVKHPDSGKKIDFVFYFF